MGLSKLPKCLGLRQESKGYFPHYFNTPENEQYEGPLPPPEAYGVQHMMPSEQKAFLKWHEENKTKTFNLQRELAAYCQQDVNILVQACTKYRHEIMTLTKKRVKGYDGEYDWFAIDPLQYPTLAGVCLSMYKFKFLKKNKIAIPHPDNYHRQCKRYSSASIQWLSYIAHKEKTRVQHALNGGEICIDSLYVDGYMVLNGRGICLEFLGCFFHGCALCYHSEDWNPLLGKTYGALFNATQERTAVLRSKGFEVRSIWEHEWKEMVRSDSAVKNYLASADFPEPLVPREALFGGRTNAIRLYYRAKPEEQILYYDFTSLYPYVNKTKEYPLGHPKIIFENFEHVSAYFGFVKAKISPPRGLFFPVLPTRVGGKLMFVLCATCAESRQRNPCKHTDEERALMGTWCTIELNVAIKKGYKVLKIFEVWHFESRSADLFSNYIELHLRHKQEASGYPAWCVSEGDKNKYIDDYKKKEGISLRKDKIAVNPAKRQIAKLFLNSLWGKFGQRTNLPNTQVVREPDEYFNLLFSESYTVSMFEFLADDAVCVTWKHEADRLATKGRKNEFIACFTTAYARLELYNLLDKLQDRVLYHDTDSVIFVQREGEWKPPLGDYLGDLTSEVPEGLHITEYVSGGPKTYGYKLSDGSACMKVKGITLNVANSEKINFDSLRDLVFTYDSDNRDGSSREIVVEQPGIVRDKCQWLIHTKLLRKTQKVVYDKRVIVEDFKTLPYGY
uniref:DNA-directed DNA polymerase n=1 Tax=Pogona vitticeps TaxID=103695 RepID=A0ABM5FV71_9SAUR